MSASEVTSIACARERKARIMYSPELLSVILERVADGESLNHICSSEDMPSRKAFFDWVAKDPSIQAQYELAISLRADIHAEEILAIADEEVTMIKRSKHSGGEEEGLEQEVVFDPTAVARNRLRVDARKWILSKMAPKKYGDKIMQEIDQKTNHSGTIEISQRPKLTREEWLESLKK